MLPRLLNTPDEPSDVASCVALEAVGCAGAAASVTLEATWLIADTPLLAASLTALTTPLKKPPLGAGTGSGAGAGFASPPDPARVFMPVNADTQS
jgi:hypothetical protein